jgi:SP family myo-inositol transporter-like MFS transporter 13
MAAMVVPVYISEAAPIEIRGTLVTTNVLFITMGQFISYCTCLALGSNWRWMLMLAGVPSIL